MSECVECGHNNVSDGEVGTSIYGMCIEPVKQSAQHGSPLVACGCTCKFDAETLDLRVPVTIVLDLSIHDVPVGQAEKAIEALRDAVIAANIEEIITERFSANALGLNDAYIVAGTRWNPVGINEKEIEVQQYRGSGRWRPFDLKADKKTGERK